MHLSFVSLAPSNSGTLIMMVQEIVHADGEH